MGTCSNYLLKMAGSEIEQLWGKRAWFMFRIRNIP